MPDRFVRPELVEFMHSRWYTIIHVVDRFGSERYFKASADGFDTEGDGLYFAEVGKDGEPIGSSE